MAARLQPGSLHGFGVIKGQTCFSFHPWPVLVIGSALAAMADKGSLVVADVVAATVGSHDLVVASGALVMRNSSGDGSAGKPANGGETVEDMMQRLDLTL
jgi:hypothetical protein